MLFIEFYFHAMMLSYVIVYEFLVIQENYNSYVLKDFIMLNRLKNF
jgi:hypothetical protein